MMQRLVRSSLFRLDIDYIASENFRVAQLTPPGSECSIIIRKGITSAMPGSVQGLHRIVVEIEASRSELVGRGVEAGEVLHGGVMRSEAKRSHSLGVPHSVTGRTRTG